jgi:hypothetical protein
MIFMTPAARAAAGVAALAALLALAPGIGRAATEAPDPSWPCAKPAPAALLPSALWSGSLAEAGDWRAEPKVSALVYRIAPRSVALDDGIAAIADFAATLSPEERRRLIPLALFGLVDETNRERGDLIGKLKDFGERQRNLSSLVTRLRTEQEAIPPDAQGEDAKRREDLEQRLAYTGRAYDGMQRTLRYACEAPMALETRLKAYAQALEAKLK